LNLRVVNPIEELSRNCESLGFEVSPPAEYEDEESETIALIDHFSIRDAVINKNKSSDNLSILLFSHSENSGRELTSTLLNASSAYKFEEPSQYLPGTIDFCRSILELNYTCAREFKSSKVANFSDKVALVRRASLYIDFWEFQEIFAFEMALESLPKKSPY